MCGSFMSIKLLSSYEIQDQTHQKNPLMHGSKKANLMQKQKVEPPVWAPGGYKAFPYFLVNIVRISDGSWLFYQVLIFS